jgi:cytochrome c biogenesis protein CcmG/thiol:disulfide interchange protein DsbE
MERSAPETKATHLLRTVLNLQRLVAGGLVVLALALPTLLFLMRHDSESAVEPARLLAAPAGARVSVEEGKLAPDFAISTSGGDRVRLSGLRGRPVLINFWARWCGSCLSEMPEIKALQERQGPDGFTVLAVNAGETRAEALPFIDFLKAPFVYGLDTDLTVTDAYGVYGLPLSVFIDSDGVVRGLHRGHADRTRLEALVSAAGTGGSAGETPFQLRLISTIPRDRLLTVTKKTESEVVVESRSLRCDASYCAKDAVAALSSVPGIASTRLRLSKGEPTLTLRFDRTKLSADDVVAAVRASLEAVSDPVYTQPPEVRYSAR